MYRTTLYIYARPLYSYNRDTELKNTRYIDHRFWQGLQNENELVRSWSTFEPLISD